MARPRGAAGRQRVPRSRQPRGEGANACLPPRPVPGVPGSRTRPGTGIPPCNQGCSRCSRCSRSERSVRRLIRQHPGERRCLSPRGCAWCPARVPGVPIAARDACALVRPLLWTPDACGLLCPASVCSRCSRIMRPRALASVAPSGSRRHHGRDAWPGHPRRTGAREPHQWRRRMGEENGQHDTRRGLQARQRAGGRPAGGRTRARGQRASTTADAPCPAHHGRTESGGRGGHPAVTHAAPRPPERDGGMVRRRADGRRARP